MAGASAFPAGARVLAAATAAIAFAALVGQFALMLQNAAAMGIRPVTAAWRFLGYFTILTNALVALAMAAVALGRVPRERRGVAVALTGLMLAIGLVGVVYHAVLAALWSPQGLQWWVDQALHSMTPALALMFWIAFVPKAGLRYADAPWWMAWPSVYAAYAFLRGAADGWFPYPFIDATRLGWHVALGNAVALAVAFLVTGLLLVFLCRRVTGGVALR